MKPKPFEELLAGATPGEWNSYYLDSASVNPGRCAFIHGPKTATMDKMTGFKIEDAEYIARCSPAVMREVWGALNKLTHECDCMMTALGDRGVESDSDGMMDAANALESGRRALAALNGEKPENKEPTP